MNLSRLLPRAATGPLLALLAACGGGKPAAAGGGDAHGQDAARQAPAGASATHAADAGTDAMVRLTPQRIAAAGIGVVAVGRGDGASIRLAGRVEPAPGARAAVASSVTGRVERVLVAPGSAVEQGQALAIVVSGEAALLRANALAASAEAKAARLAHARDRVLVEQGVVARQDLETSHARALAAQAQAAAAQAQAAASGAPDASGRTRIVSPLHGMVGSIQVTPGSVVGAGSVVAEIADPGQNELVFAAPPVLAAQVAPGMPLEVSVPGRSFAATVTGVATDVHQQAGMAVIRAQPVAAPLPPAGTAVAAVLVADRDAAATTLSVPSDALQTIDGRSAVFVAVDGGFRARPVLAGRRAGNRVEILDGLRGDERVASANAFLLKAELAKGEAAHGH